ncbi:josephin [Babesia ovis]|uniref:ubiquitinyl hydrolase 1 n=1 Tax=Babesia ovis TaxID=5869 RepID=A0A9W5TEH4_BABOV|nr:josephin [Babesia ovis]
MENTVYWEKQNPQSKLCALHCLNAFLQGPKVTNEELLGISKRLGNSESALLRVPGSRSHGTDSMAYSYDSDGGDFDVTVLIEALRLRNFQCNYYTLNDMKLSMFQKSEKWGFICNAHKHWFCVRMLMTDQWFILDSLRPGPQEIEYGALYSYISTLLESKQGAVFLVSPMVPGMKLPVAEPKQYPRLESHQMFLTLKEIRGMFYALRYS